MEAWKLDVESVMGDVRLQLSSLAGRSSACFKTENTHVRLRINGALLTIRMYRASTAGELGEQWQLVNPGQSAMGCAISWLPGIVGISVQAGHDKTTLMCHGHVSRHA